MAEKWFISGVVGISEAAQRSDAWDLVFRIFVSEDFEVSASWLAYPQKCASFKESNFQTDC